MLKLKHSPCKKLYICVPNFRGWIEAPHHQSMLFVAHAMGQMGRQMVYLNPNNTILTQARQFCVDMALEDPDCEYVLFIDDDMVFGAEQFIEFEQRFLDGKLDYLCALAFANSTPTKPCIFGRVPEIEEGSEKPWWTIVTDYPRKQVFEVLASGFGMVLISKKMLDAMRRDEKGEIIPEFQHFKFNHKLMAHEDVAFGLNARAKGFKLYCDSGTTIGHISKERPIICEEVYDMWGDSVEYGAGIERRRITKDLKAVKMYPFDATPLRVGHVVNAE